MFAARAIAIGLAVSMLATGAHSVEVDQTGSIQRPSFQGMARAQPASDTAAEVSLPELSVATSARRQRQIHIKEYGWDPHVCIGC